MSKTSAVYERRAIHVPNQAPAPLGAYSHAVMAGPFLYLSGQGARDPETGIEAGITLDSSGNVTAYDIVVQTHACIRNLKSILTAAGCTLENVIDMNVFLADINDFQKMNQVYAEYFNFPGPPARTTVQAAALPGKNFIEIKAVALCPTQPL